MQWSNRIALVLVCAVALTSAKAYAGGADTPPGEPPHGVAFMERAKGTKLYGVITIELTEVDSIPDPFSPPGGARLAIASTARGVLRLRRGGQIATFYSEVEDIHECVDDARDPDEFFCVRWEFSTEIKEIQDALLEALVGGSDGILDTFFGDECPNGVCSLGVATKLVEESAQINVCLDPAAGPNLPCTVGPQSLFLVADITLAVK